MNKSLSLKHFEIIFRLAHRQPWLIEREKRLLELIEICEDANDINLLSAVVDNFTYLSNEKLNKSLKSIVNYIVNELKLEQDRTQIVALTYDGTEADSGQMILQLLKPIFPQYGWNNPKTVNLCTKAPRNVKDRPWIILVDEFLGSGQTLSTRIEYLEKQFSERKIGEYCICVCMVACMLEAKKNLEETKKIDIYSPNVLNKGISESFYGEELHATTSVMAKLETYLLPEIDGKPMPSFGFNKAEALYGMDGGNCPNSVFPIFWWPKNKDGANRNTLLCRVGL